MKKVLIIATLFCFACTNNGTKENTMDSLDLNGTENCEQTEAAICADDETSDNEMAASSTTGKKCDECSYLKALYDSVLRTDLDDATSERLGRTFDSLDGVYTERGYYGVEGYLGKVCHAWGR